MFLDTPSVETAKNVLRINTNGIGFSTNGVNGSYRNAWTIDGSLVADFITTGTINAALAKIINIDATNINTGTLNADLIKAGTINSTSGNVSLNLDFGIQEWRSDFNGQEIEVAISSGMLSFRKVNSDGTRETYGYITTTGNSSGKLDASLNVSSGIFSNGVTTEAINSKAVSWTYSNELGKYVLTGA